MFNETSYNNKILPNYTRIKYVYGKNRQQRIDLKNRTKTIKNVFYNIFN